MNLLSSNTIAGREKYLAIDEEHVGEKDETGDGEDVPESPD